MSLHKGYSFDAAAALGIGKPSTEPLPTAAPGEVILRIPDGLTLHVLRKSPVGKILMWQMDWYDKYQWSNETLPAGIYLLRVPVPNSNRKTVGEQEAILPVGETLAPAVMVAAALICIRLQGGSDPLNDGWTRCREQSADGNRVVLTWVDGRLYVDDDWGGDRSGRLWAASVRTS